MGGSMSVPLFDPHAGVDKNKGKAIRSKIEDLADAAAAGQLDIVRKFLRDGANVNAISVVAEYKDTPLMAAACNGKWLVVGELLKAGADITIKAGPLNQTALEAALASREHALESHEKSLASGNLMSSILIFSVMTPKQKKAVEISKRDVLEQWVYKLNRIDTKSYKVEEEQKGETDEERIRREKAELQLELAIILNEIQRSRSKWASRSRPAAAANER